MFFYGEEEEDSLKVKASVESGTSALTVRVQLLPISYSFQLCGVVNQWSGAHFMWILNNILSRDNSLYR